MASKRSNLDFIRIENVGANAQEVLGEFLDVVKKVTRKAQSAINVNDTLYTTNRTVDKKTGQAYADIVFDAKNRVNVEAVVNKVLGSVNTGIDKKYGVSNAFTSSKVQTAKLYETGKFEILGKKALAEAEASAQSVHGRLIAEKDKLGNPTGMYRIQYPSVEDLTKGEKSAMTKKLTASAKALTKQEKIKASADSEILLDSAKDIANTGGKAVKAVGKAGGSKLAALMEIVGKVTKIVGFIVVIADITRRILTAVLSNAQRVRELTSKAHSLGSDYIAMRQFEATGTAMGIGKDTIGNAMQTFQDNFGDIKNLNENAIKILAPLIGGDVAHMVQSGLGGYTPDKLMEITLNKAFENWQKGINSLGHSVGQEQAQRELVTVLKQISPDLAKVFNSMVETYKTGAYAGMATTFQDYNNLFKPMLGGMSSMDFNYLGLLGDEANKLKATFEELKNLIGNQLIVKLSGLLGWLNSLNIGRTGKEVLETDKQRTEYLEKARDAAYLTKASAMSELESNKDAIAQALKGKKDSYGGDLFKQVSAMPGRSFATKLVNFLGGGSKLPPGAVDLKGSLLRGTVIAGDVEKTRAGEVMKVLNQLGLADELYSLFVAQEAGQEATHQLEQNPGKRKVDLDKLSLEGQAFIVSDWLKHQYTEQVMGGKDKFSKEYSEDLVGFLQTYLDVVGEGKIKGVPRGLEYNETLLKKLIKYFGLNENLINNKGSLYSILNDKLINTTVLARAIFSGSDTGTLDYVVNAFEEAMGTSQSANVMGRLMTARMANTMAPEGTMTTRGIVSKDVSGKAVLRVEFYDENKKLIGSQDDIDLMLTASESGSIEGQVYEMSMTTN